MSEQDTDGEVIEQRDVSDIETNEEIEEEVDDMLDDSDLEQVDISSDEADTPASSAEESDLDLEKEPREEEADGTEVELSGQSVGEAVEEYEDFDFEDQEWNLDQEKEPEVHDFRGTKILFDEPEDDGQVLNSLAGVEDIDEDEQMREMVKLVVQKPEITDERWQNMSVGAKLGLSTQAADYLGLNEDFLAE